MMRVFVTVGTTKFPQLVEAVLSQNILHLLRSQGYTSLTIQAGNSPVPQYSESLLDIEVFDYKPSLAEDLSFASLDLPLWCRHLSGGAGEGQASRGHCKYNAYG